MERMRAPPPTNSADSADQVHSPLHIFNLTLVRAKEHYIDPAKLVPRDLLRSALQALPLAIPEVLIDTETMEGKVAITVADKREVFDVGDVSQPWHVAAKMTLVLRFLDAEIRDLELTKAVYAASNGMLSSLDPRSVLISPKPWFTVPGNAPSMKDKQSYIGDVGLELRRHDGKLIVAARVSNGPASLAGIKGATIS